MLGILLINAIFSIIFPIGKLAMVYAGPFFTIGVRMVIGGILLLTYRIIFPERSDYLVNKNFWWNVFLLA
ncbi:MAG: hypothetical protein M1114_01325, partial [Candidatus Dependentiae bacterium]|nr:hypothetical protein [Candidatus Dependentiae bacterium]